MTTVGWSGSDALLGVVAATLLVVTYGQWLYRSRRLGRLQERVRSRVAVVRELIDSFARRIDAHSEFEWIQPANLISDEQVFAGYDTERRLEGLRDLLWEALKDLASLEE